MSASGTFLPPQLVKEMPPPVSLNTRGRSSSSGQWNWELGESSKDMHYFIHFHYCDFIEEGSKLAPRWLALSGKTKFSEEGAGT